MRSRLSLQRKEDAIALIVAQEGRCDRFPLMHKMESAIAFIVAEERKCDRFYRCTRGKERSPFRIAVLRIVNVWLIIGNRYRKTPLIKGSKLAIPNNSTGSRNILGADYDISTGSFSACCAMLAVCSSMAALIDSGRGSLLAL